MWLIDNLRYTGTHSSALGLQWFVKILALACLIKVITETHRRYFSYFEGDSYLRFLAIVQSRWVAKVPSLFKLSYVVLCVASCSLLLGQLPRTALILMVLSLLIQMAVYFRYNTNLLFLLSFLCVVFAPSGVLSGQAHTLNPDGLVCQLLLVSTISTVYISASFRKVTRVFLSGSLLHKTLQFAISERQKRKYWDGWYPSAFVTRMIDLEDPRTCRHWRLTAILVCVMEAVLPFGLLSPYWSFAVGLGIALHVGFTLMFPATLGHFSLICVGSYVLFINPQTLMRLSKG